MGLQSLDEKDLQILLKLLANSRLPFKQLARELEMGESTLYLRIKKLMKSGILRRFTVEVDLSKLGGFTTAFIELKVAPGMRKRVIEALKRIRGVSEAYEITGEYPILVKVLSRSHRDLTSAIDKLSEVEGVIHMKVNFVMRELVKREVLKDILREFLSE